MDDLDLLKLAKSKDNQAFEVLYKRYVGLSHKLVKEFFFSHDYPMKFIEDFMPEIDFVFLISYRTYKTNKGSFNSYFTKSLQNRIKRFIGRCVFNNDLLRRCISLDSTSKYGFIFHEVVEDKSDLSPISYTENRDILLSISTPSVGKGAKERNLAKAIIMYKQEGYCYDEIAKKVGLSRSKVIRLYRSYLTAIQRLKMK